MNTERQTENEIKSDGQAVMAVADPSLSLAAKKLAGSTQCLNCGTGLKGPFCYYCGQPDRNFLRFFPVLLRDLMEDLLDLDSRFMRTLKPLLFKPGRLTRDYMQGRRFRYAPPMRLYIFSSIVFFLLAAVLSSDVIPTGERQAQDRFMVISSDDDGNEEVVADVTGNLPADTPEQQQDGQTSAEDKGDKKETHGISTGDIQFNDKPWNRETNPVDIRWLPDWLNDRINDEVEESPQKAEQINANPNLIIDKIFDILPATMFILLPVVALIFKFWYLFAKRFYIEHLIFALHNHAFLFVALTLILLINLTGDLLGWQGHSSAASASTWLSGFIGAWIPLYMLISLRVVYQQNWLLTIGKFVVIGLSYVTLLTLVTSAVAITSFVLL